MVACPPQLVWLLVKDNNAYLRRNVNNTWFSTEKGNLYGRSSYKYSGICNDKTVCVEPAGDAAEDCPRAVTVTKSTVGGKTTQMTMKKPLSRMQKAVEKEVGDFRPDLARAARARVCNVHQSLRKA